MPELVWRAAFLTRVEASIDSFYNPVRRHWSLDFVSPAAF